VGNEIDLSVLQEQNQKIFDGISELTKSVSSLVGLNKAAAKEKEELTEKQKKEEEEQKMFKRFVRMLKEEGAVFTRKQGKVTTAPEQRGETPVTKPEEQQAVIQGQQERRRGDEYEEEYPEAKAKKPEEYEEEKAKKDEECETKAEKDEEEEKKAKKPEEYPEVSKLKKENEELKAQLTQLQNSVSTQIDKAVEKKLQELGWKSIGHTPVKISGETMILKSDKPVSREDLLQELKKLPLAQLNDMHFRWQAGELQMPEVTS